MACEMLRGSLRVPSFIYTAVFLRLGYLSVYSFLPVYIYLYAAVAVTVIEVITVSQLAVKFSVGRMQYKSSVVDTTHNNEKAT